MKRIAVITTLLTSLCVAQNTVASEETLISKEVPSIESNIIDEKKLTTRERISLKLEEKKRLRETATRRSFKDQNDLVDFYIEELKYEKKIKGLLREAAFYFDFLLKNHDNYKEIEKESANIGFNSICLAANLSEAEFFIAYESISSLKMESDLDKEKFAEANHHLMEAYKNNPRPRHTQEEINIRCKEVYK